jgi:hypothetical protein
LQIESGKLAVDLNVVERYQDVYPTKKQTRSGTLVSPGSSLLRKLD